MTSVIATYLTLQIVKSFLGWLTYDKNDSLPLLFSVFVIELVCFGIDVFAIVKFSVFFCKVRRNNEEQAAGRPQTCWDKWNGAIIMYLIVGITGLVALYRILYMAAFNIYVMKCNPSYDQLTLH